MRRGLGHCRNQGYRRRTAADHHDAPAAVVEILGPVLRVDDPPLELLAAGEGGLVPLLVVVVAAAQEQEVAGVAHRCRVVAHLRVDSPA